MRFNRTIAALSLFFCCSFIHAGCDRFQNPSKEECEEYVDHVISLMAKDETGDEHPIAGRILHVGARGLAKITGDYQNAVRQCMSKSSKHQVRCALGTNSLKELEDCE